MKESAQQSAPLPLLVEGYRKTFAEKLKESEKMKIKCEESESERKGRAICSPPSPGE